SWSSALQWCEDKLEVFRARARARALARNRLFWILQGHQHEEQREHLDALACQDAEVVDAREGEHEEQDVDGRECQIRGTQDLTPQRPYSFAPAPHDHTDHESFG